MSRMVRLPGGQDGKQSTLEIFVYLFDRIKHGPPEMLVHFGGANRRTALQDFPDGYGPNANLPAN